MIAELAQRHRVQDLVQRAEAAGQRHERIGRLDQLLLAIEHRRRDPQLAEVDLADLAVEQSLRDDAQDRTAGRLRAARGHPHQPDVAAAVDQPPAAAADRGAELPGGGGWAGSLPVREPQKTATLKGVPPVPTSEEPPVTN